MVDMSGFANTDGKTTEEKLQAEIAGDDVLLKFVHEGQAESFFQEVFKEGVTFEWIKNKVAENMEANYNDLSLFVGERRIPEPFCPVDMKVTSGTEIIVKLAAGALTGEARTAQIMAEIAAEEAEAARLEEENKN